MLYGLRSMPRTNDTNVIFVRARVPKDIHLEFKIAALKAGKDMDKILNELIVNWLEENKQTSSTQNNVQ